MFFVILKFFLYDVGEEYFFFNLNLVDICYLLFIKYLLCYVCVNKNGRFIIWIIFIVFKVKYVIKIWLSFWFKYEIWYILSIFFLKKFLKINRININFG